MSNLASSDFSDLIGTFGRSCVIRINCHLHLFPKMRLDRNIGPVIQLIHKSLIISGIQHGYNRVK